MRPASPSREHYERLLALLVAAGVLLLVGWVMWQVPIDPVRSAPPAPRLRWLLREPVLPGPPLPAAVELITAPVPAARARPPAVAAPPPEPAQPRPTPATGLYDAQGRPRLLAGNAGVDGRSQAERVFEDLPDVLAERRDAHLFDKPRAGSRQSRTQRAIYGEDIQAAQARPPPAVAYNPARHERAADLASAGSAQAYLSAPISDQPAPGLDGAASAQLLPQQAALQAASRCAVPAMRHAWAALADHLRQLQQAEYRHGHGSSPIEREHTLTHEVGRQYNLARRALWQVQQLRDQCPP
jgi:hypothetical protein